MADVLKPELLCLGSFCYRINPGDARTNNSHTHMESQDDLEQQDYQDTGLCYGSLSGSGTNNTRFHFNKFYWIPYDAIVSNDLVSFLRFRLLDRRQLLWIQRVETPNIAIAIFHATFISSNKLFC